MGEQGTEQRSGSAMGGEQRTELRSGSAMGGEQRSGGARGNSPTAKDIVRSFYELWNKGSAEDLARVVSENVIDHDPLLGQTGDFQGAKKTFEMLLQSFSKIELKVEKLISQGDIVASHWSTTAMHSGNFMGIPATNKQVILTGTDMFRIQNGKIVEVWHDEDFVSVLQQIGGLQRPEMPEASEPPSAPGEDTPAGAQGNREAAVRNLIDQFALNWNTGDVQAMVTLFTADAVLMDNSGQRAEGTEAIQTMLNSMLQGWAKNTTAAVSDVTVRFLGPLAAYADATLTLSHAAGSEGGEGGEAAPMALHMTAAAILRAISWKMSDVRLYNLSAAPAPSGETTPQPPPEAPPMPAPGVAGSPRPR